MPSETPPPAPIPVEPAYDPEPGPTPYPEITPNPSPAEAPLAPATPGDGRPYALRPPNAGLGTQASTGG
jgi:hypothetical protein